MAIICNYITDRLHFRSELERGIHADIIAVAYRRNLQIMSTGKRSGEYVGTRGSDYSPADNIPEVMFLSKHTPPGHITGERVSRSPYCRIRIFAEDTPQTRNSPPYDLRGTNGNCSCPDATHLYCI